MARILICVENVGRLAAEHRARALAAAVAANGHGVLLVGLGWATRHGAETDPDAVVAGDAAARVVAAAIARTSGAVLATDVMAGAVSPADAADRIGARLTDADRAGDAAGPRLRGPAAEPDLVSVVMPAYNAARFVEQAMRSVLDQDYPGPLELIVADDASTDETADVVARMARATARSATATPARRLRIAPPTAWRRGPAAAKNRGLALARGAYVTFFDADDVMSAGAVAARVRRLIDRPDAAASFGRLVGLIDAAGMPIASAYHVHLAQLDALQRARGEFGRRDLACGRGLAGYTALLYPRAVLRRVADAFDETLASAEDFDFAYRVLAAGPAVFVDHPVLHYRLHGANTSCTVAPNGALQTRPETTAEHLRALAKHGLA